MREELADFAAAVEQVPELGALLRNPRARPAREGARRSRASSATPTSSSRNFLRLLAEKGRAGEIGTIAREFERLVAAEQRRLEVELTTALELSDDEAAAIVGQIEQASGRKVEATRRSTPT